jgi:hypothetical protein
MSYRYSSPHQAYCFGSLFHHPAHPYSKNAIFILISNNGELNNKPPLLHYALIHVPAKQHQQEGVTMTMAFTEQRSNANKNEEPKQEEVNQGMNEVMVGVAKKLVTVLEG